MVMRRCDADEHYYDDQFELSCPQCYGDSAVTRQLRPRKLTLDDIDSASGSVAVVPGRRDRESSDLPVTAVYGYRRPLQPVIGWLVINSGPPDRYGRDHTGTDLRLVHGINRIGQAATMSVQLDFGDRDIARVDHCSITCEPLSSHVYLEPGESGHLTYYRRAVEADITPQWQLLLQRFELTATTQIKVGSTVLQFVPLKSLPAR